MNDVTLTTAIKRHLTNKDPVSSEYISDWLYICTIWCIELQTLYRIHWVYINVGFAINSSQAKRCVISYKANNIKVPCTFLDKSNTIFKTFTLMNLHLVCTSLDTTSACVTYLKIEIKDSLWIDPSSHFGNRNAKKVITFWDKMLYL